MNERTRFGVGSVACPKTWEVTGPAELARKVDTIAAKLTVHPSISAPAPSLTQLEPISGTDPRSHLRNLIVRVTANAKSVETLAEPSYDSPAPWIWEVRFEVIPGLRTHQFHAVTEYEGAVLHAIGNVPDGAPANSADELRAILASFEV